MADHLAALRAAAQVHRDARIALDEAQAKRVCAVRAAHEDGVSMRAIATTLGVSHQLVARMLERAG